MISHIRTIKPSFFRHEKLFEIEEKSQLPIRLAFIGLLTCCDREGRFRWRPHQLKLDILPYDNVDFATILDLLADNGFIKKYVIDNETYGCFLTWHKHQYINGREQESQIPPYPHQSNKNDSIELPLTITSVAKPRDCTAPTQPNHYITPTAVQEIFEHWKKIMGHPDAKLDFTRQNCIKKALATGYSVTDLCKAIEGCQQTPHNMGDNDRGQLYNNIQIIFRDADHIDRFIQHYHSPPKAMTKQDQLTQINLRNIEDWLANSNDEPTKEKEVNHD